MPGAVASLGILWERNAVIWKPLALPGKHLPDAAATARPGVVDFAKQHAVYLLHRDREIIYVGQTVELGPRLREHTKSPHLHNRWNRFSWFGFREVIHKAAEPGCLGEAILPNGFGVSELTKTVEGILIAALEPRNNGMAGVGFNDLAYGQP